MGFQELNIKIRYRSDLNNFPRDFLVPVLEKSLVYKRGVGYFSTSSLIDISSGVFEMAKHGGKMQLVCSPNLDDEDIRAINLGYEKRDEVFEQALLREIHDPIEYFDTERLNLIVTLIADGILDIKLAFLEDENGISLYHEKMAIFIDENGDKISYIGSMNESGNAFNNNFESFYTFCSWKDESQKEAVEVADADFDNMWHNNTERLHVIEFPKIVVERLMKYKKEHVDFSIDEKQYGYRTYLKSHLKYKVPDGVQMRDYQLKAVNNWFENRCTGIFNMSTGSGKTFTALYGMVKLAEQLDEKLAVFVVCPYIHLVSQWEEDAINWGPKPIIAHSKSPDRNWEQTLLTAYKRFRKNGTPFICITTLDTFSEDKIQKFITRFDNNQDVLLIVDEAHNFGSESMTKVMPYNVKYRLGLSATIKRYMDKKGTSKLYDYFGKECIDYGLEEAIRDGNLVHYNYYPIPVYLTRDEFEKYQELSRKLKKYIIIKNGKIKISDAGKPIIYERTRLLAAAVNKIGLLMKLMDKYKKDNNILIYCGATSVFDEASGEEVRQIDLITDKLQEEYEMSAKRFTAEEDLKERMNIKEYFSQGMYQVITAIKCLDEGVNIPGIKTAFILSSSRNPKEFIQRRGRLLRKSKNKTKAIIYDFVTLPRDLDDVVYGDYDEDKTIILGELARMEEFGRLSDNPEESDSLANRIMSSYDTYVDIDEEMKKWRITMENNNEVDKVVLRELFNAIRNAEIKNVKIQKLDDKQMAKQITKYISKKWGNYRMKFKSITLHNFMRYKGDNTLLFSTDSQKNVTVVLGDNTFGKTTLAQAFRWGLYETFNETNYTKKKDIVLLNNEIIADMDMSSIEDVYVEIIIQNEDDEWKFVRKASFNRKSSRTNELQVKQIGDVQLTMQIRHDGKWGNIIDNNGNNVDAKKYKKGCVQETIENMFPSNLSNYFFFDGERWNDLKSKTADIKDSIDTILGVSGLIEMKKHLKDNRINVMSLLRQQIKGTSGEYARIEDSIKAIEDTIEDLETELEGINKSIDTAQRTFDSTLKTLNDNRKVEDDQKEYNRILSDIESSSKYQSGYYADIVREFSKSAKYFAVGLLPRLNNILENIDLQGKDIPGVTVDTLDYIIDAGECICGTKIEKDSTEYKHIENLRKLVPPEMLGGAAGKLQDTLEDWDEETHDLVETIVEKADDYSTNQDRIYDLESERDLLARTMDKKTNLGPVRKQNLQAKNRLKALVGQKANIEMRIKANKDNKVSQEARLDEVAIHDKENEFIYRALAYVQALYDKACFLSGNKQQNIIEDLNKIIKVNFAQMFNDHEKYAQLEDDYKIHVYYYQLGELSNYEEENLSNGETIAINFVFIVSILELAKKYRQMEADDSEYGMENAILGLPLVLDGPFSALSNDNTSLVANRLPEFAEQVIIFMLDKDWEASGLEKYTLPEYCYRVAKDATSNSSSLEIG